MANFVKKITDTFNQIVNDPNYVDSITQNSPLLKTVLGMQGGALLNLPGYVAKNNLYSYVTSPEYKNAYFNITKGKATPSNYQVFSTPMFGFIGDVAPLTRAQHIAMYGTDDITGATASKLAERGEYFRHLKAQGMSDEAIEKMQNTMNEESMNTSPYKPPQQNDSISQVDAMRAKYLKNFENSHTYSRAIDSTSGKATLGSGTYMSQTPEGAMRYGNDVRPITIKADVKMLDLTDPQKLTNFTENAVKQNSNLYLNVAKQKGSDAALGEVMKMQAQKLGFGGIKADDVFGTVVFDNSNIANIGNYKNPMVDMIANQLKNKSLTFEQAVNQYGQALATQANQTAQGLDLLPTFEKAMQVGDRALAQQLLNMMKKMSNYADYIGPLSSLLR